MKTIHVTELTGEQCGRKKFYKDHCYEWIPTSHAITASGSIVHSMLEKAAAASMQNGLPPETSWIFDSQYETLPERDKDRIPLDMYKKLFNNCGELAVNGVKFYRDHPELLNPSVFPHFEHKMLFDVGEDTVITATPDYFAMGPVPGFGTHDRPSVIVDFKSGSTFNTGHEKQVKHYASIIEQIGGGEGYIVGEAVLVYLKTESDKKLGSRRGNGGRVIERRDGYKLYRIPISGKDIMISREEMKVDAKKYLELPNECNTTFMCNFCDYRGICNGI